MQVARIELLQRMSVFGGIRADILRFLLDLCPVVSVPANEFFFREHDQADSMFVLEAGKVAVLKSWRGQEFLLRILKDGDCFGEMAVMDLLPRSASIRAVEDCTAIRLSAASLYQVYEHDLKQFALIQMNMGREVSRRLRDTDNQLFRARMGTPEVGIERQGGSRCDPTPDVIEAGCRERVCSLEQLQENPSHRYKQEQENGLQNSHHPRFVVVHSICHRSPHTGSP